MGKILQFPEKTQAFVEVARLGKIALHLELPCETQEAAERFARLSGRDPRVYYQAILQNLGRQAAKRDWN